MNAAGECTEWRGGGSSGAALWPHHAARRASTGVLPDAVHHQPVVVANYEMIADALVIGIPKIRIGGNEAAGLALCDDHEILVDHQVGDRKSVV